MKILFLDIDGVMNSQQSFMYYHQKREMRVDKGPTSANEFCPIAVSNLNYLLSELPDLRIVISSSWRIGRSLQHLQSIFKEEGVDSNRIIAVTPHFGFGHRRGQEISKYMEDNSLEIEEVVVVDDDSDMDDLCLRLVQTNGKHGLCWADMQRILNMFHGR